jgi:hypothetical protein
MPQQGCGEKECSDQRDQDRRLKALDASVRPIDWAAASAGFIRPASKRRIELG